MKLDDESWRRLYTWIDLNVPFYGSWSKAYEGDDGRKKWTADISGKAAALRAKYALVNSDWEYTPTKAYPITASQEKGLEKSDPINVSANNWPFDAVTAQQLQQKAGSQQKMVVELGNGIAITMPYWDERVLEMQKSYPDVTVDKYHIDILAAMFVLHPDRFDVVVGSNLFGDILSDLGPACTGTIGIAPSGNINPERKFPSLFEPVHGSAPDIAGQNKANPCATIMSAAMLLRHSLNLTAEADAIEAAVNQALLNGARTGDIAQAGDTVIGTQEMGDAVLKALG